ncbi:MAG: DUF1963 domain-containing protein [Pseudomonadota bacterium]
MRKFLSWFSNRAAVPATVSPSRTEMLLAAVESEIDAMDSYHEARAATGPSVALLPLVPPQSGAAAGWLGGAPRLPKSMPWPEIDGKPALFLAQLDLSHLPKDVWSGVGPRSGQIAVFVHTHQKKAVVLHLSGELERREGPSPEGSNWLQHYHDSWPQATAWPEWPVEMVACEGPDHTPERNADRDAMADRGFIADDALDFTNPAFWPFDAETLAQLIAGVRGVLEQREVAADNTRDKKLSDDTRAAFEAQVIELKRARTNFDSLVERLAPHSDSFDFDTVGAELHVLNDMVIPNNSYLRNEPDGTAVIETRTAKLTDPAKVCGSYWGVQYLAGSTRRARFPYLRDPSLLPEPVRRRCEGWWAQWATQQYGQMSHAPIGFVYTPHGPGTPNEVLLELPTDDLIGWIWGDCYSLLLSIPRDNLARGVFDDIMVDITN